MPSIGALSDGTLEAELPGQPGQLKVLLEFRFPCMQSVKGNTGAGGGEGADGGGLLPIRAAQALV